MHFESRRILAVVAGLSCLGLSACQPKPKAAPSGAKRYKVGFANLQEDMPFAVRVREGIQKAAKDAGNIDLICADNRLDGKVAMDNANNFITQQVDGVIEFQTDAEFGKEIMRKFNEAHIPVIAIDIPMPGATFFGVNNYPAGHMAGANLGNWIKANWGGKVDNLVMLELPQSGKVPAERLRGEREGLESVVGKFAEPNVVHLDSKNTLETARALVADTLTRLPNAHHIAVVCINDDTALGAINAAEAAGRKNDIAVCAVDASDRGREEIRKPGSPHKGSTASFPEKYGEHIIPVLLQGMQGKKMPESFYTTHIVMTKDNVDKYYPNDKKQG
ncbi:MAG TPA: sugar ABC transporter substrate-binding protein [Armatimonadota bacterium]|jgi:ribose transport system substrate-binding protein